MSEARSALSYLCVVALIPASLGVGWLVGRVPARATTTPPPPLLGALAGSEVAPAGQRASDVAPVRLETPAPPKADPVSAWTTYDGALAESGRNGKPVLLDFNADWCPPCQRMKQELFDDRGLAQSVQTAVIPVSIVDRRRETGSNPPEIEALQRKYKVTAFPTLVVFSPATGRMETIRGYGGAVPTLDWITEAARAVR